MSYSPYSPPSHSDYPRPLIRRPSLPLWSIVLLGAVLARLTAWIDSETLSWSAGVLVMVVVSVWCGLRYPHPRRWLVGVGTLLTMLLLLLVVRSYNLTWMLIGTLIAGVLVYGYGYLSSWLVRPNDATAVSTNATTLPVSRGAALAIPLLIQLALLLVTWSYMERPGTALDLVRRANGIRQIHAFPASTNVVVLSPDGTRAVSMALPYAAPGDPDPAQGQTFPVSVWDVRTGTVIQTLHQPLQGAFFDNEPVLSQAGELVAIDNNAEIRVWQVDNGKLIAQFPSGTKFRGVMQFSPDASLLAVTSNKQDSVQLWSLRDGSLVRTLGADTPFPDYDDMAFTPDGQLLALRDRRTVTIWRVADGTLQRTLESKMMDPLFTPSLAFSPDGQLLASSGDVENDQTVAELWRVGDGTLLHTLRDDQTDATESFWHSAIAFSADGTRLMTTTWRMTRKGGTDIALLWNVQDGRLLRRIDPVIGIRNLRYAANEAEFLVRDGPYLFALPSAAED